MSIFERFFKGRNLVPSGTANNAVAGDLEVLSSTNKIYYHNGTTSAIVPTVTSTDTFSGKTISGASNTLTVRLASDVTGTLPNANTTAVSANTASAIVTRDGSGNFAAGTITATLTGNATNVSGVVAVANGGTNSSAALNNNRVLKSSGGAIIEAAAITASKALASDGNGIPVASATTATELGYVNGVTSAIQTQLDAIVALTFPAGVMLPYGGSAAPTGFLLCDGSSVLRATYPNLFTAIGTSFGSVDGTHFTLPNTARRVLMGAGGSGTATIANTVGSTGGEENHALITAELASHTHTGTSDSTTPTDHTHGATSGSFILSTAGDPGFNVSGGSVSNSLSATTGGVSGGAAVLAHTHTFTTAASGSGTAHNTVQPSVIVNFIIKT